MNLQKMGYSRNIPFLFRIHVRFGVFLKYPVRVRAMVFNATFNNISAALWWSVLLVEKTGVPGEYHRYSTSH